MVLKGRGRAGKATQQWLSRKVVGRQTNGQVGRLKTSQMNTQARIPRSDYDPDMSLLFAFSGQLYAVPSDSINVKGKTERVVMQAQRRRLRG
jgi:hypothetical protein